MTQEKIKTPKHPPYLSNNLDRMELKLKYRYLIKNRRI